MVATATRPERRITVFERLNDPGPVVDYADRVDLENAIIRGVKIVGLKSINPARVLGFDSNEPYYYAAEALAAAAPLYEGTDVHIDHPEIEYQKDGTRRAKDDARGLDKKFGWLENIQATATGLYGDLHYLKSHPMAKQVIEFVIRRPDKLGLSHVADVIPQEQQDNRIVVVEIVKVYGVDLIGESKGTVISLFESGDVMAQSVEQEEQLPPDMSEETAVEMGEEEQHQLEMEHPEGEDETQATEQDEALAAPPPEEAVNLAFKDAIIQCLDDPTLTADEKIAKIGDLIKGQSAAVEMIGGGEETEATEQAEETTSDEEEKSDEAPPQSQESGVTLEALAAKIDGLVLERENERRGVRTLESAGVRVTRARIDAVASITNDDALKTVLEAYKAADGIVKKSGLEIDKPRSGQSKPAIESATTRAAKGTNNSGELSHDTMYAAFRTSRPWIGPSEN